VQNAGVLPTFDRGQKQQALPGKNRLLARHYNVDWQPARPRGARISGLITTGKIEHCHVVVAFDGGEDSGEGGLISA
jgi:hypothetical protein